MNLVAPLLSYFFYHKPALQTLQMCFTLLFTKQINASLFL
jgi:hypothetical protein